jgi:Domain of unknown function (DUF1707)
MTEGGGLRVGNTERTAAMKALDEHLSEGRLEIEEYGDRSATAASATTADELRALFTDLPQPHPVLPGDAPALPPTAALPVLSGGGAEVAQRPSGALETWAPRIAAITPILAFAIFAATGFHAWWIFFLIPVVGGLAYGGRDHDDRDRARDGRRLARDERRDRRHGGH